MDDAIRKALDQGHVIDITTTGRRSGEPRRIEIVFHNVGGRIYISGMPRPGRVRAWLRNLEADPNLTVHLKGPLARADLAVTARVITDPAERREVMPHVARTWSRTDIDAMVAHSPLIEVTIPGYPGGDAA
jgi:deazaflavin-dependent oxidoreductase (nitroreductase family)